MNRNGMGLIGLARRAGKLLLGADSIEAFPGRIFLILLAVDASDRSVRTVHRKNAPVIVSDLTKTELGHIVGCNEAAAVAVTDSGLAEAIRNKLGQQEEIE